MTTAQKTERAGFLILFAIFALLGLYVIYPFLKPILLSIAVTVIFFPLNERILKKWKRPNLAAALSVAAMVLLMFIPLVILASLVGSQIAILLQKSPTDLISTWYVSLQIWITKIEDLFGVHFNLIDYYQRGLKQLGTFLAGI